LIISNIPSRFLVQPAASVDILLHIQHKKSKNGVVTSTDQAEQSTECQMANWPAMDMAIATLGPHS
jgi:hypothetical protein